MAKKRRGKPADAKGSSQNRSDGLSPGDAALWKAYAETLRPAQAKGRVQDTDADTVRSLMSEQRVLKQAGGQQPKAVSKSSTSSPQVRAKEKHLQSSETRHLPASMRDRSARLVRAVTRSTRGWICTAWTKDKPTRHCAGFSTSPWPRGIEWCW